ncbi:hypothetical protein [Sporisorium scitamineum]|uniref:Serine hydrolase FSH domain-containing protein n=1 Tax=Sporisorium scitamineum TaxID=49012 RepID=A0A0F7SCY2_9BASI|nr:hypothetical protein [Sporisorium scitamineum]
MADRQQPIVLCLHGWGSRPQVFEVQLRTLVKPLRDLGHKMWYEHSEDRTSGGIKRKRLPRFVTP